MNVGKRDHDAVCAIEDIDRTRGPIWELETGVRGVNEGGRGVVNVVCPRCTGGGRGQSQAPLQTPDISDDVWNCLDTHTYLLLLYTHPTGYYLFNHKIKTLKHKIISNITNE